MLGATPVTPGWGHLRGACLRAAEQVLLERVGEDSLIHLVSHCARQLPWGFEPKTLELCACELRSSHSAWRFQDGGFSSQLTPLAVGNQGAGGSTAPAIRSSPLSFKRLRAKKREVFLFLF